MNNDLFKGLVLGTIITLLFVVLTLKTMNLNTQYGNVVANIGNINSRVVTIEQFLSKLQVVPNTNVAK